MCSGGTDDTAAQRAAQTVMQQPARQTLLFPLFKAERDYSTSYSKIRLLGWRNESVLSDERTQAHKFQQLPFTCRGPFILRICVLVWNIGRIGQLWVESIYLHGRIEEGERANVSQTHRRVRDWLKSSKRLCSLISSWNCIFFLLKLSSCCQYFFYTSSCFIIITKLGTKCKNNYK